MFDGVRGWGWRSILGKQWAEVVCPNSPYFLGGVIAVELTFKSVM